MDLNFGKRDEQSIGEIDRCFRVSYGQQRVQFGISHRPMHFHSLMASFASPYGALPGQGSGWRGKLLRFMLAAGLMAWLLAHAGASWALDVAEAERAPSTAGGVAASGVAAAPSASASAPERKWLLPPRVIGRITAKELGLVINEDDPYSVEAGAYYARMRGIPANRVLKVKLPLKPGLSALEFAAFARQVNGFFGADVQGLALAWRQPYAVECNSITGALALGFDAKLCSQTCAPSRVSPYFASASSQPFKDHKLRPSMLLAAQDVAAAKALIDRGVAADGSLGLRGAMPVRAHFVTTSDAVRSVRQVFYPPAGLVPKLGFDVVLDQTDALRDADRVLLYMTGRERIEGLDTVRFVPGALADHLTSFGGVLESGYGQMTALAWINAGATASYGTTSEPCSHLQKFPHPQALLLFYAQGSSALEAYWKSVAWPQQGLFIGEPLAAPFAR
jgi:uncharacterized protein (TIGR03790 family)